MRPFLRNLVVQAFVPFICIFSSFAVIAQNSPVKFGKISGEDFANPVFQTDTASNAIVISDIGSSVFEGNSKGWFTLKFKRHTRIFIKNKNGYDAGTIEISLYSSGENQEKLTGLKANTYNIENGKLIITALDNKSVYEEKKTNHWKARKFAMPAIKEGSIIEYTYTIESDFLTNLQPWHFQGNNLCLWSEYKVEVPSFFDYVFLVQGYQPFFIKTTDESSQNFSVTERDILSYRSPERYSFNASTVRSRWVIKNVPPLKEESYISSPRNYISKIEFQLSAIRFPDQPVKPVLANWQKVSEDMMTDEDFGAGLKNTGWLKDVVQDITAGAAGDLGKAKKIFYYVAQNFTASTDYGMYTSSSLKQTFKRKNGNVADINILLTAMLQAAGFKADPVLCATKEFGRPHANYPLLDKYNYVLSRVYIGSVSYLLDASDVNAGFGTIGSDLYNGTGRAINVDLPSMIEFNTDSLKEVKSTFINIINDEKFLKRMSGLFSSNLGNDESKDAREKIRKSGEKDFWKSIQKNYGFDIERNNQFIDSLKNYECPVKLNYSFTFPTPEEGIIYFNPLLGEGYGKNPFKSTERLLPIEMPYASNEVYILNMEVPDGYVIDEMPKSVRISLNENEGTFEYMIGMTGTNSFQVRNIIQINRTSFDPEDYKSLRDFFGAIVAKHSEFVIFKKKK